MQIKAGEKIVVELVHDSALNITCDGKPITITCDSLKVSADSGTTVKGNVEIKGQLKVSGNGGSTTISGHEIRGA